MLGRLLEVMVALVLTGALAIVAGPYILVWTLHWMVRVFG